MHKQPFDSTSTFDQMMRAIHGETELDFEQLFFVGDQPITAAALAGEEWQFGAEAFTGLYSAAPNLRFLFPGGASRILLTLHWLLSLSIPQPATGDESEEPDSPDGPDSEMDHLGRMLDAFMEAASEDLPCIFCMFGRSQANLKSAILMYPAGLTAHRCLQRLQDTAKEILEVLEATGNSEEAA